MIVETKVTTIADKQWHYICADLTVAVKTSSFSKYSLSSIKYDKAWVAPGIYDMYIDTINLRKTTPYGYNGKFINRKNKSYWIKISSIK